MCTAQRILEILTSTSETILMPSLNLVLPDFELCVSGVSLFILLHVWLPPRCPHAMFERFKGVLIFILGIL